MGAAQLNREEKTNCLQGMRKEFMMLKRKNAQLLVRISHKLPFFITLNAN
jgi:hypothetical protein